MVIAQGLFTILFTVRIYYTNNRNLHVKGFCTDKYLKWRLWRFSALLTKYKDIY